MSWAARAKLLCAEVEKALGDASASPADARAMAALIVGEERTYADARRALKLFRARYTRASVTAERLLIALEDAPLRLVSPEPCLNGDHDD